MLRSLLDPDIVVFETSLDEAAGEFALLPAEAVCVERAVASRRREFAAGRHCARQALAALGVAGFVLLPDDKRVPVWPPGIVGSISHGAGSCGVAVARTNVVAGLGVDIEEGAPLGSALAERICRSEELERASLLPRTEGVDWPKLLFSAKESIYKAYFPLARTFLGFHDVNVVLEPEGRHEAQGMGAFVGTLLRDDVPSAAGLRVFRGRYAVRDERVYTAVALAASDVPGAARVEPA